MSHDIIPLSTANEYPSTTHDVCGNRRRGLRAAEYVATLWIRIVGYVLTLIFLQSEQKKMMIQRVGDYKKAGTGFAADRK